MRVFGGMGVDHVDGPVSIGGPRQRRLLALLAIRSGSVVSIDWLAEHLWNDDERPEGAGAALRVYVSRLRHALPTAAQDWIQTEASGYRFAAPDDAVEHRRFATLRARARDARDREDPQTAHELLTEALGLWQGDPFRELEDVDDARAVIEQLHLDRLEAREEQWEVALALGRHTQITGELATFTAEHRLRDRATRQYAIALHRNHRTAEALRVIRDHRRTLADEAGLDPSAAIVELEAAILSGDPALDAENLGRPLRGYRLLEQIGSGAFSVVWRGVQPSVDREVAVKQIRAGLASQPEFIRQFEAEAHLVARIEHPHIVPLIDFWRDPDCAYLVMRWLRGGTLEQRLDAGPLPLQTTLALARQIGDALSTAHANGVVHRDVKAANILFDELGNAFLGDFGIALEVAGSAGQETMLSPGSPAYSAPEQIRREPLGPAADIFSLGVVIFECLTGSLPFGPGRSHEELVERQLVDPSPTLSAVRADIPESFSDAIARSTANDPADRFESVADFLDALESTEGTRSVRPATTTRDVANPYIGLRAFDAADADRFFGRRRLITEIVGRLAGNTARSRCVAVVGPSGSGKSSVVRGGLVPALRHGAVPGSDDWFVTTMTPGADPFESLAQCLLRIAVDPPAEFRARLRDGRDGILRGAMSCFDSGVRALIVIDQFEEVFTNVSHEDADRFLSALSVAVEDPASPLAFALTLRADYYDRPLSHPAFAPILSDAAVDVMPLAPDELEQAIVEPARRLGVEFEPGLAARIAAETNGQPSPLPLLQFTLSELFDRRSDALLTTAAYDELGGIGGALAARAEAVYDEANEAQRSALRRIFGRMTNPGTEAADLRRRVPVADLGADSATEWVLERLGAARLVTFDRDVATREPTVEVAHEALLREWPRLVEWLNDDREVLRIADGVAAAATNWEEGGRQRADLQRGARLESSVELAHAMPDRLRSLDREFVEASQTEAEADRLAEQRRVRRLRRLVGAVAAALVIALLAGGLALRAQRRATDEAAAAKDAEAEAEAQALLAEEEAATALAATEQAQIATLISRSAALTSENPQVSLLLALEAHRRAPRTETEQALLNALGSTTVGGRLSTLGPLTAVDGPCPFQNVSPDGTAVFAVVDGVMVSQDTLTGTVVPHGSPPAPCVVWGGDSTSGRRWAATRDARRAWFGPYDGEWEFEREYDDATFLSEWSFGALNRVLAVTPSGQEPMVTLLDGIDGEPIGAPTAGGDQVVTEALSADGSLAAVSFGTRGRPEGDGTTIVVDGETGDELFHVFTAQPALALEFDERQGELIAAIAPREIVTIDVLTGEIVSSAEVEATSDLVDIGIRPDGLIVVVSGGQIELVDRRSGPMRPPTQLQDTILARVRPDGTVFAVDSSETRIGVIDPEASALVEQTWEIDPFARVAFNAGRAATIVSPTGNRAEVIDLTTGAREITELFTTGGDRFLPVAVYPELDGLSAVDEDNAFGRWRDGELVSVLDLEGAHITGTRHGDLYANVTEQTTGGRVVQLVDVGVDGSVVVFTVAAPDASEAHPTIDGGLHVVNGNGSLDTYDAEGEFSSRVETGQERFGLVTVDPTTGKVALANRDGGVVIVDPATNEVDRLPRVGSVTNVGFAKGGALLAITSADGTVRLWDVERRAAGGLAWDGSGAISSSPSWYDESTDSIWVASSGKLLKIPLEPQRWVARACEIVGRDLTQEEWNQFVPGGGTATSACADR